MPGHHALINWYLGIHNRDTVYCTKALLLVFVAICICKAITYKLM